MPTFLIGDMWSEFNKVDHFVITTNSVIKNNGALVMGAGIAKQVRDRFPGIDVEIGQAIKRSCGNMGVYHVILGKKVGIFQVKRHYKDAADLELIRGSAEALASFAKAHPERTFALNFPGIGNGKRAYNEVLPLLMDLPNNVHVWTFD